MERRDLQLGRELPELALPAADEARRHDDERRHVEAPGLLLDRKMRDRLERLPEPHVVGEDAADVVLGEVLQPGDALDLVWTEQAAELGTQRRHVARALDDGAGALHVIFAALPTDRALAAEHRVDRGQTQGSLLAETRFHVDRRRTVVEIDEDLEERDEPVRIERKVLPLADRNRAVTRWQALQRGERSVVGSALEDLDERGQEVDPLTVHLHA